MQLFPGVANILTNASYTISSNPCRVYSVYVKGSGTTTLGTLTLYNNAAAGTAYLDYTVVGTGGTSWTTADYSNGVLFPNGCYASPNSRTTYSTIVYQVLPA